jgi:hypothetical protein
MLCVAEECCSTVQVKNVVLRLMDAVLEPIESVARSIALAVLRLEDVFSVLHEPGNGLPELLVVHLSI